MWVRRIGTRSAGVGLVLPIECARAMKLSKKDFVVIRMVANGRIEISKFVPNVINKGNNDLIASEDFIQYD